MFIFLYSAYIFYRYYKIIMQSPTQCESENAGAYF